MKTYTNDSNIIFMIIFHKNSRFDFFIEDFQCYTCVSVGYSKSPTRDFSQLDRPNIAKLNWMLYLNVYIVKLNVVIVKLTLL